MEGSSIMTEITLSYPFRLDDYGNIAITGDSNKIWADRVRSVIGTVIGERVMRPTFGSKVAFAAFATRTSMEEIVRREVERGFYLHLPLLTLIDITFDFNDSENLVSANITYELPDKKQSTTDVGIVVLAENNPPYEEIA
jgi:phage baseplate assembly protein W